MFIAYTDAGTGKALAASVAPGVAAEEAAAVMHLAPGSWRVVSEAEAAALRAPALAEVKAAALARLQEKRLEEEYAGPLVAVEGKTIRFPSTVKDETRLNSLAGVFAVDPSAQIPDWKVAPGMYVTMTAALLQQVKTLGFAHIAATFSIERAKAAAIEACGTVEAVAAWLADELDKGWPGRE